MNFTSPLFLFYFLPIVLVTYYAAARYSSTLRKWVLILFSVLFYAWINPWFVVLLLGVAVLNYVCARRMAGHPAVRQRRLWVIAGVTLDLLVLIFFKYTVFIQGNLNALLGRLDIAPLPLLQVVLPIGVSFYIFKAISYLVDVYRDKGDAGSLVELVCYLSFFPQVLSGPIQRFASIDRKNDEVLSFIEQIRHPTWIGERTAQGIILFMLGFSKKVLVADYVMKIADKVFAARNPGTLETWFGTLAYSFQLYFDFAGYSDMAIGLGLMTGLACARNFNAPYRAHSITDFWRRWHISLSGWFRDYLYITLGGGRRRPLRVYMNLVIVFLLCGLWHGAAWTFVVWGAYHGLLLVLEHLCGNRPFYAFLPKSGRILLTFLLISVGWVFFRAPSMLAAWDHLAVMFIPTPSQGPSLLLAAQIFSRGTLLMMALCALLAFQPRQGFDWSMRVSWSRTAVATGLFVMAVGTSFAQSFTSFLYFQF